MLIFLKCDLYEYLSTHQFKTTVNMTFLHSFYGSGIQKQFSQLVLVQFVNKWVLFTNEEFPQYQKTYMGKST